MASPVLQELIERLGEKDAERLYNAAITEGVEHLRKHVAAAKVSNPEKAAEADVMLTALDAVDDDVVSARLVSALDGVKGRR